MDLTNLSATTYLSIFGVVVLLICIALIFSQRATPLRTPQRIRGFGVELEISVLTLLVLVGFILSLSSIYIQISGYQQQLTSSKEELGTLKSEIALAKSQLEAARKFDMTVFVNLEGASNPSDMPKLGDLRSTYTVRGQSEPIQAYISRGIDSTNIRLTLKNITPETLIERLEVVDGKTQRVWVKTIFYPLNPTYELKKGEHPDQQIEDEDR